MPLSKEQLMYSEIRKKYAAIFALVMLACIAVTTSHLYLNELSPWAMSVLTVTTGFLLASENGQEFSEGKTSLKNCVFFSAGMLRKIVPLYFVCMILALAPYIFFSFKGVYTFDSEMITAIILQALMLHAWSPKYVFQVNGVCWFFPVCLLLFLLFPAVNTSVKKLKTRRALLLLAAAAVILQSAVSILVKYLLPSVNTKWFNIAFPPCRIFDFTLGCIAAQWVFCFPDSRRSRFGSTAVELCAVTFTLLSIYAYYYTFRYEFLSWSGYAMIYSLPSMFLVICLARSEGYISKIIGNSVFAYLGFFGASVYLVHRVVSDLLLTAMTALKISENIQQIAVPVLAVLVSFAAAIVWNLLFGNSNRRSAKAESSLS